MYRRCITHNSHAQIVFCVVRKSRLYYCHYNAWVRIPGQHLAIVNIAYCVITRLTQKGYAMTFVHLSWDTKFEELIL